MKKVLIINGSNKKSGETLRQVQLYGNLLEQEPQVDLEYLHLSEYQIKQCIGCQNCFDRGEERCPLKDDLQIILGKIQDAQGLIFVSPVYSLQVTASLKILIDRLSYLFHRSDFYRKKSIIITPKGALIPYPSKYLREILSGWLVEITAVSTLPIIEFLPEKKQQRAMKIIQRQVREFQESMVKARPRRPSMKDMISYNIWKHRAAMKGPGNRDYDFFTEKGLFKKPYFYDVKIGPLKRVFTPMLSKITLTYMKGLLGDLSRAI